MYAGMYAAYKLGLREFCLYLVQTLLLHRKGKLGTVDRETSDKMAEDDPVMETEAEVGGGVMLGWTA